MDTFAKDLLQQLECPVCMEYMLSPITMCKNRHNICNNCRSILKKCPVCRLQLNIRNVSLENKVRGILQPCIYRKSGCKEVGFQGLISKHQSECPYGPHNCPFAKVANENCKWEGPLAEVKSHIISEHNAFITEVEGKQLIVCTNYTYYRALFALGEVFFYFSTLQGDMFYVCILYVGSREHVLRLHPLRRVEGESQGLQLRDQTRQPRKAAIRVNDTENKELPGGHSGYFCKY